MIILSQDKMDLVDTKRVSILQDGTRFKVVALYQGTSEDYDLLGWYKSVERCIKVLSLIEDNIKNYKYADMCMDKVNTPKYRVFEMPIK